MGIFGGMVLAFAATNAVRIRPEVSKGECRG
jgi:hypothetical protein